MAYKFNSPAGQTIDRKLYLCCGNSGTYEAPNWGRLGKRVEDSSAENDWGEETKQDIGRSVVYVRRKQTNGL